MHTNNTPTQNTKYTNIVIQRIQKYKQAKIISSWVEAERGEGGRLGE